MIVPDILILEPPIKIQQLILNVNTAVRHTLTCLSSQRYCSMAASIRVLNNLQLTVWGFLLVHLSLPPTSSNTILQTPPYLVASELHTVLYCILLGYFRTTDVPPKPPFPPTYLTSCTVQYGLHAHEKKYKAFHLGFSLHQTLRRCPDGLSPLRTSGIRSCTSCSTAGSSLSRATSSWVGNARAKCASKPVVRAAGTDLGAGGPMSRGDEGPFATIG